MLNDRVGLVSSLLVFVGFNLAFFPQHLLGLRGMPRRIYTYLPETGWGFWNLVSTIGAFGLGLGALLFFVNAFYSLRKGPRASADPWGSPGLEWAGESPPRPSAEREMVIVPSRYPLWIGELGRVTGLAADEQLVTKVVDARPDHVVKAAVPNIMPCVTAVATAGLIVSCLFTPWGLPIGLFLVGIALFVWFWPTDRQPAFDVKTRVEQEMQTTVWP
jgi:heme/copper-type cytochrome/quinol oxidase subunit 1